MLDYIQSDLMQKKYKLDQSTTFAKVLVDGA